MALMAFGTDAWFMVHPGFPQDPKEYVERPENMMSYEFASFLNGWGLGHTGDSPFHTRNFRIAQRKSCYKHPLLTRLGFFTPQGEIALARAQGYIRQIYAYYASLGITGSDVPSWEQAATMDTILVAALMEEKHIIHLRELYNRVVPPSVYEQAFLDKKLPDSVKYEFQAYDGVDYMLTACLRRYPQQRLDFETLVRYGLAELFVLPRNPLHEGRGRPPVGARITESGKRFYADFLEKADPIRKKNRERLAEIYKLSRGE